MDVTLLGPAPTPAVAVVGTWEPFLPYHTELLQRLRRHAEAEGLTPLAVMFDPPPTMLQDGEARWPLFDDTSTRVDRLRRDGIDAIALVRFEREDLNKAAADFFEAVCAQVPIAEFWLRDRQILGQRAAGSRLAIAVQCVRRSVKLTPLPPEPVREVAMRVREHLARGEVAAAGALVGRPPTRSRCSGRARVAWKPGQYDALAFDAASADGRPLTVDVVPDDGGMSAFTWPSDAIDRLSFVSGPGDVAGAAPMTLTPQEAACA